MAQENLTIFQRLSQLFGAEGPSVETKSYAFDKKQLLRTTDKKKYDRGSHRPLFALVYIWVHTIE